MADILVIEDDQRIRELVCRHLAGDGYGVTSEGTGLDGLRTLTANPPDALVLDLGLPDLDGLDLLKMVRSVADLPVLILTAREDEATILAAFEVGAFSDDAYQSRLGTLLSQLQPAEVVHVMDGLSEPTRTTIRREVPGALLSPCSSAEQWDAGRTIEELGHGAGNKHWFS